MGDGAKYLRKGAVMEKWIFNEEDKKAYGDMDAFVPDEVFDAHAHIYRSGDLGLKGEHYLKTYDEVGLGVWEQKQRDVFGGRELGALVFPFPTPDCDVKAANSFLIEQLEQYNAKQERFRGLMLLDPSLGEEYAKEALQCPYIEGFKPYYCYSSIEPKFQSPIEGFLPEWACRLADEKGLVITLHMVKDDALSDPGNLEFIRNMCEKHPKMKLILAHAARGFYAPNTVKAIGGLRGIENVWFDSSAVCETSGLRAILMEFGPAGSCTAAISRCRRRGTGMLCSATASRAAQAAERTRGLSKKDLSSWGWNLCGRCCRRRMNSAFVKLILKIFSTTTQQGCWD